LPTTELSVTVLLCTAGRVLKTPCRMIPLAALPWILVELHRGAVAAPEHPDPVTAPANGFRNPFPMMVLYRMMLSGAKLVDAHGVSRTRRFSGDADSVWSACAGGDKSARLVAVDGFSVYGTADTSVSAAPATAGAYTPWTQVPPTFEEGSGNKYSPATILRSPAALSAKPVAYGPPAPGKTLPGWPSSGATPFNQILSATSNIFDPLVKSQMAINPSAAEREEHDQAAADTLRLNGPQLRLGAWWSSSSGGAWCRVQHEEVK